MKTLRYLPGAVFCLIFTGCASVEEDRAYWSELRSRRMKFVSGAPKFLAQDEELYQELYWREEKYLRRMLKPIKPRGFDNWYDIDAEDMNRVTPGTATVGHPRQRR